MFAWELRDIVGYYEIRNPSQDLIFCHSHFYDKRTYVSYVTSKGYIIPTHVIGKLL